MSGVDPVQDWATAETEFRTLTGQKKPSENVAKFFKTDHGKVTHKCPSKIMLSPGSRL